MTMYDLDAERAMLCTLLSEHRWNRAALRVRLEHLDQQTFDSTFALLICEGLAVADRKDVEASRAVRYLATFGVLNLDAPDRESPDRETLDRIVARSTEVRNRVEH